MVRVKICGITNIDDAMYAAELGTDAVGFIFYRKSPRFIDPDEAGKIVRQLPPFISAVGVFVNEEPGKVIRTARRSGIDTLQLHGDEPPDWCDRLGDFSVIKAFRVAKDFDPEILKAYKVSAYLLDTYAPGKYGGTGKTFDWQLAVTAGRFGRIIASGGIGPDNVIDVIQKIRPYAVDVNSGVEIEPGKKDRGKLSDLFEKLKEFRHGKKQSSTSER